MVAVSRGAVASVDCLVLSVGDLVPAFVTETCDENALSVDDAIRTTSVVPNSRKPRKQPTVQQIESTQRRMPKEISRIYGKAKRLASK